jgi:hypothetical protein
LYDQFSGEISIGGIGQLVSRIILSVVTSVVFKKESRNLVYIVLTQSHVVKVHDLLDEHQVQFVGDEVLPYATCTHHIHQSVGHVILSVTQVVLVTEVSLLITKPPSIGAVISYRYVHVLDIHVLPAVSCITNLKYKS